MLPSAETPTTSVKQAKSPFEFQVRQLTDSLSACVKDRKSTRLNSSHLGISYAVFCLIRRAPSSSIFPYTTLFRSARRCIARERPAHVLVGENRRKAARHCGDAAVGRNTHHVGETGKESVRVPGETAHRLVERLRERSEEHTSELQSLRHLVCRLLLDPSRT